MIADDYADIAARARDLQNAPKDDNSFVVRLNERRAVGGLPKLFARGHFSSKLLEDFSQLDDYLRKRGRAAQSIIDAETVAP